MDEINSLLDEGQVSYEWTTLNGVNGGRFTDMATGNSIFLPAAGCRYDGKLTNKGNSGLYLGVMQNGSEIACLRIGRNYVPRKNDRDRVALSVRSVAE